MASSADKERARRAAIEESWVIPDDPEPKHAPRDDERPNTARLLIVALKARGWTFEEASATVHDRPRWMTEHPDDVHLSYVAPELVVYHLQAYRAEGELVAVELQYQGGKITQSRLGRRATPLDRVRWQNSPAISLAKTIRETKA